MGMHRSEGATALLGMDGFVVGAQLEVDGELWLMVETTTDVVGCGRNAPCHLAWRRNDRHPGSTGDAPTTSSGLGERTALVHLCSAGRRASKKPLTGLRSRLS